MEQVINKAEGSLVILSQPEQGWPNAQTGYPADVPTSPASKGQR